ncbi:hypothetical protein U1Q18_015883 [Sarracenia purpurea var. burkii]
MKAESDRRLRNPRAIDLVIYFPFSPNFSVGFASRWGPCFAVGLFFFLDSAASNPRTEENLSSRFRGTGRQPAQVLGANQRNRSREKRKCSHRATITTSLVASRRRAVFFLGTYPEAPSSVPRVVDQGGLDAADQKKEKTDRGISNSAYREKEKSSAAQENLCRLGEVGFIQGELGGQLVMRIDTQAGKRAVAKSSAWQWIRKESDKMKAPSGTELPLISSIYPKNHNLPPLHNIELVLLGHQIRLHYRRGSICFIQFRFPDLVDKGSSDLEG